MKSSTCFPSFLYFRVGKQFWMMIIISHTKFGLHVPFLFGVDVVEQQLVILVLLVPLHWAIVAEIISQRDQYDLVAKEPRLLFVLTCRLWFVQIDPLCAARQNHCTLFSQWRTGRVFAPWVKHRTSVSFVVQSRNVLFTPSKSRLWPSKHPKTATKLT